MAEGPSSQPKPSADPEPLQPVQLTSFWPATLTHLPSPQLGSLVQKQPWPCAEHAPPGALQPPFAQDHVSGERGGAASQGLPSQTSLASGDLHDASSQVAAGASGAVAASRSGAGFPASLQSAQPAEYSSRPAICAHAVTATQKPPAMTTRIPRRPMSRHLI